MATTINTPSFDELPLDKNGPRGNAWGRFGKDDNLGTLNLLTPQVVAAAAKEIKLGERVSLDWTLNKLPSHPSFGRQEFVHKIHSKAPRTVNDDIVTFNTQGSSQWDGLRHYGYQDAKQFYCGVTQDQIESSDRLSTHHVVEHGGITGRGVLIDYADYAARNNIQLQHFESTPILLKDLQAIIKEKNIKIWQGDILFVRSGFISAYEALASEARAAIPQRPAPNFIGVEATEDVLRWLWSLQPAAVAGDQPAFERCPISGPHSNPHTHLHEWLIAGWGMPIGEMLNLDALSKKCKELNRWSFFVSSVHLKIKGGVASPPNAVAIF